MHLSKRERITLLMIRGYSDRIRRYEEAANLFNDTFPNRPPIAKSTVQKTVRRFEQFGFIKDKPRTGRPKSATNEEKSVEVMQSFIENKYISIPKAAQEHEISTFSVHRILKLCKFRSYKVHLIQQLTEDDFDRRVEFCDVIIDEATFYVNGTLNRHNCRYVTPEKVNVWCGIVGRRLNRM
ncbi:hypothetical protein NQ315_016747 [Exocentrus adspersus]|uniref:DUF4817 domain-containing protein n=1 Tax=Exocentrus adspersus TaxID=1586481 RepID=A0AAV8VD69_9CUCU|nr:hypothetical protein NQ315_016747 [Exocentrus adspersus]